MPAFELIYLPKALSIMYLGLSNIEYFIVAARIYEQKTAKNCKCLGVTINSPGTLLQVLF